MVGEEWVDRIHHYNEYHDLNKQHKQAVGFVWNVMGQLYGDVTVDAAAVVVDSDLH